MKPLLLISTFIGFSFYQLFGGAGIRLQNMGANAPHFNSDVDELK